MYKRIRTVGIIAMGTALTLGGAASPAALGVALVDNGEPRAAIVLPDRPAVPEVEAANELIAYIERISGARLPVITAGQSILDGVLPIYLGRAAPDELLDLIRAQDPDADPESFVLRVREDRCDIRGLERPEGTRHGIYELLEQLGIRWFAPGEFYTVIPEKEDVEILVQETVQVPSFSMRQLRGSGMLSHDRNGLWQRRNRLPGIVRPVGQHGMPPLGRFDEEHPERYGIVNGERDRDGTYCLSNPETLEAVVAHIVAHFAEHPEERRWVYAAGTHDHPRYCECPGCLALDGGDWDPFQGSLSQTDRWVWFFNRLLDRCDEELPDKELEIAFYAYGNKIRPPVRWTPDPRLRPTIAPITNCRRHSPVNPICPDKKNVQAVVAGWTRYPGIEMYDRGFWFNLASIGTPFPMWHRLGEEIPWAYNVGIKGWSTQATGNWGADLPSFYIAAKLMWNPTANVDELMDDFAAKFFGPAEAPMRAYYRLIGRANNEADLHTGSDWDVPLIFTRALRTEARGLLNDAHAMLNDAGHADDSLYALRVQMVRDTLEYTDAFCRMLETRSVHDWQASYQAFQELERLREILEQPAPLSEEAAPPAIVNHGGQAAKRFTALFGKPTIEAYERVTAGNVFVAGLAAQWDFLLDRQLVGESLGFQAGHEIGGNWQSLLTSRSWSSQGLHHYKGEAWYRQSVVIPAAFGGQRVFLWFGGVHNQAKVWVNGTLVGLSHTSAFRPFEFDVTGAVRPGAESIVAVRISSTRIREVGTGGIVAPVFFYAPAKGAEAAPEYPLADEFPINALQIRVPEGQIP
ncbi:MAG: DUF4838 domain-containing protein [Candidatus Marinimicrobia bacterium]|nr:DUF4838 domain-containing protein [Candidatus Neomarinimicrobiota bacterium]